MIVFKNYLKVAKSYLGTILLYTVIFMVFAIISTSSSNQAQGNFEASKANISIINEGEDSLLTESFSEYIENTATLVTLENKEDTLKDALFFRKVDYIMILPSNFTEDFLNGKEPSIDVLSVPDSVAAIYSKQLMNRYLNIASLYVAADIPIKDFVDKIKEDIAQQATVTLAKQEANNEVAKASFYYNFANYTLLAIILSVTTLIMLTFNEEKIKRRTLISPLPYKVMNRQLLLGNLVFSFGIWLLYVIISFALYSDTMSSQYGLLFIANSFMFMTTVLAIAFFLVNITSSRQAIGSISNVLSLGTSFIAGAFVPQEMLSNFVLSLAKITPSYWYIKNNNIISSLTSFSSSSLQSYLINLGILLLFSCLLFIATQSITKLRLKK